MNKKKTRSILFVLCAASVFLFMRCGGCQDATSSDMPDGGFDNDGGTGTDDAALYSPVDLLGVNLDGAVIVRTGDGGTRACYYTTCQGKLYSCGDCIDNDGDGLIDSDDPDCLGPCDNTESGALTLGIPGGNNAPCKADCYFDQDTGGGNDDCSWDHSCDPLEVAPNYYPEGSKCKYSPSATCTSLSQTQSATCHNVCDRLTPNACDCFGCCAIGPQANTTSTPKQGIWLGSLGTNGSPSCTLATLGDPAKCHPCTIVESCYKTCGKCQYCLGDPPTKVFPPECYASLPDMSTPPSDMAGQPPADMTPTGTNCPAFLCLEPGKQACAPSGSGFDCAPCPAGTFCNTGCCQPTIG